jgi:hypothetical protein
MASSHGPRRDPDKQRFWQARIARWRRSGLSVREFCRRESLAEPLFYAWRRELARREAPEAGDGRHSAPPRRMAPRPAAFVPVEIVAPPRTGQATAIEVLLPRGHRLRVRPGFDRKTLEAVLDILERPPC